MIKRHGLDRAAMRLAIESMLAERPAPLRGG